MRNFLLFIIVFFLTFSVPCFADISKEPIEKAITTYDYNTMTVCQGKDCTAYIGWSYAYDVDNKWKMIDDAFSLKNSSVGCSVNSDGINLATCLDWNTSFITVNLTQKNAVSIVPIPVKVWHPTYYANGTFNSTVLRSNINVSVSKSTSATRVVAFTIGDMIEYGSSSTTITLNESNSGNVGDSEVDQANVKYNYGHSTSIQVWGSSSLGLYIFILWNMSVIPSGSTITNASMSLYKPVSSNNMIIDAYNTSAMNTTGTSFWNEGTLNGASCGSGVNCNLDQNITWNNKPSTSVLQDSESTPTTTHIWVSWNVTNATISSFANTTYPRMSIMLEEHTLGNDEATFASKEYATVSQRPQLVITYTAGGDSTPPTFSSPSINTTLAGRAVNISIKISDETALSGYIFSTNNTGTWINTTWSSLTSGQLATNITTLNSTSGVVVNYTWYANDSSNNWATNINSTTTTLQNLTQNYLDSTTATDTKSNTRELLRNMLDSTSPTDTLSYPRALLRSLLDYSTNADNFQALQALLRSMNDATQNSDSSSLIKELVRYIYDSSLNADSSQQLRELLRNINDLTTDTDANSTSRELVRSLYDSTSSADTLQQLREKVQILYDSTVNSDANANTKALIRYLYDYSQSIDNAQSLRELIRVLYDSSNSSDLSGTSRELLRSLYDLTTSNDTMSYTAQTSALQNIIAIFYDSTINSDASAGYKEFVRKIYDQSQASDSLQTQRELLQQLLDYTTNLDASLKLRELSVILYDFSTSIDYIENWLTCLLGSNCPTGGNVVSTVNGGSSCPYTADPSNSTDSCIEQDCVWRCYEISKMTWFDSGLFILNKGVIIPITMFVTTNWLPLLLIPVVLTLFVIYKRRKKKTKPAIATT